MHRDRGSLRDRPAPLCRLTAAARAVRRIRPRSSDRSVAWPGRYRSARLGFEPMVDRPAKRSSSRHEPPSQVASPVTQVTRQRILEEALGLPSDRWTQLAARATWARVVAPDIIHVIQLDAWKGASYSFSWGASLGFVPHLSGGRLAWHRTLKSSSADLRELAPNVAERETRDHGARWDQQVCGLGGEAHFRTDIERAWNWADARAAVWFQTTATLAGVLRVAIDQADRQPIELETLANPKPRMVAAFAAARLGMSDRAGGILEHYLRESGHESPETEAGLRHALQSMIPAEDSR
jgi:hypothetical protein